LRKTPFFAEYWQKSQKNCDPNIDPWMCQIFEGLRAYSKLLQRQVNYIWKQKELHTKPADDQYFLRFSPIFCEIFGVFLKNQYYDNILYLNSCNLTQNSHFSPFLGEHVITTIALTPESWVSQGTP
jgi:hypothetical protein